MKESLAYTGCDNLKAMEEAETYNAYLTRSVLAAMGEQRKAVDFGAGYGEFAKRLRREGKDVVAVEPDPTLQAALKTAGFPAYGSLRDLPEPAVPFIYTLNVLEHIEDDGAALRDLHKALRADGGLLVFVPAFPLLFSSMDRNVGHFRRYTKASLGKKLRATGFVVVKAEYVDSLGFLASLGFRFFGNSQGALSPKTVRLYDTFVFPLNRVLDLLLSRWLGKNLLFIVKRATAPEGNGDANRHDI